MNKSAHPRSRCVVISSLELAHVQIPRPGPRSRPQRHPAPRRHQSWRSRVQQDSVSTLVSTGQRARRQTRRRNSPLRDRNPRDGPIEHDAVRVDHRHSVDDLAGLGRRPRARGVITGGVMALRRPQHPIREPNHRLLTRAGVFESTLNSPLSDTVSGSVPVMGPFRASTLGGVNFALQG